MQLAEGPQVSLVQPKSAPRNREEAWKAEEAADRARMPKQKRDPYLELLGCTYYTEGMALSAGRYFAQFWRALPEIRVVLDPLERTAAFKAWAEANRLAEEAKGEAVEALRAAAADLWRVAIEPFEWRGKVARANGWRWVAFAKGEKIDVDKLRAAAGR